MIKQLTIEYSGFFKFVENKPIDPNEEYREDSTVIYKEVSCDIRTDSELIIKGLGFGCEFFLGNEPIAEVKFATFKYQDEIFNYMFKRDGLECSIAMYKKGKMRYFTGHVYAPVNAVVPVAKTFIVYGEVSMK